MLILENYLQNSLRIEVHKSEKTIYRVRLFIKLQWLTTVILPLRAFFPPFVFLPYHKYRY